MKKTGKDADLMQSVLALLEKESNQYKITRKTKGLFRAPHQKLANFLNQHPGLTELEFDSLSAIALSTLANALRDNKTVRRWRINNHYFSSQKEFDSLTAMLEANTSLQHLHFYYYAQGAMKVGLSSFFAALQRNTTLKSLTIAPIELEDFQSLAEALRHNKTLTSLSFHNADLTEAKILPLAEALKVNTGLLKLYLSHCQFNKPSTSALAEALVQNKTLTELKVEHSKFTDGEESIAILAKALKVNTALRTFTLHEIFFMPNRRRLATPEIIKLINVLKTNHNLNRLNLDKDSFSELEVIELAAALKVNKGLLYLDLNRDMLGEKLSEPALICLSEALEVNNTLRHLNLKDNDLSNIGFARLAQALGRNTGLVQLDLENTQLSDDHIASLSDALRVNKALGRLSLKKNTFSKLGFDSLATALRENTTLRHLEFCEDSRMLKGDDISLFLDALSANKGLQILDFTRMPSNGSSLAKALPSNTTLRSLDLRCSTFNETDIICLAEALEVNIGLRSLNLLSIKFTDPAIARLAEALKLNSTLRKLVFAYNKFNEAAYICIAEMLKVNRGLCSLFLDSNKSEPSNLAMEKLADALRINKTLRRLDLGGNNLSYIAINSFALALKQNSSLHRLDLEGSRDEDPELVYQCLKETVNVNTTLHSLTTDELPITELASAHLKTILSDNHRHCLATLRHAVILFSILDINTGTTPNHLAVLPYDLLVLIYAYTLPSFDLDYATEVGRIVHPMVQARKTNTASMLSLGFIEKPAAPSNGLNNNDNNTRESDETFTFI